MTGKEHQVAAPGEARVGLDGLAQAGRLHVAVARAIEDAGEAQRGLHQARAVQAHAGVAAPQIGHADEADGGGQVIGFNLVHRLQMAGEHPAAAIDGGELAFFSGGGDGHAQAGGAQDRGFQIGLAVDEGAQRGHLVGRLRAGLAQGHARHIADVAVGGELAPRPAALFLIDRDGFPHQRFGQPAGSSVGQFVQRRIGQPHLLRHALGVAGDLDHCAQIIGGQVLAGRRDTWIALHGQGRVRRRSPP